MIQQNIDLTDNCKYPRKYDFKERKVPVNSLRKLPLDNFESVC